MRIENKEKIISEKPKTKKEKLQHLRTSIQKLKTEFVGLDDILDQLQEVITSWYVTPEVIERPVIVNLWGMTGTGKTSVVRRLIEELGLQPDTISFDCGQASNEYQGTSITNKICEMFNSDEQGGSSKNDIVFIFDEFQYARTIDEQRNEVTKSTLRPIWSLIDSGILNYTEFNYSITRFSNFVEDIAQFRDEYPGRPIYSGKLVGKAAQELIDKLGSFWYDDDGPIISGKKKQAEEETEQSIRVLPEYLRATMIRALEYIEKGWGFEQCRELEKEESFDLYVQKLVELKRIALAPKEIDCTKSLVFILGNLDEAFDCQDELNPDLNADLFNDITSGVTVNDIKEALRSRFRAEQIGRLGNNMILYPTLREEHFEKIINKELNRISDKFLSTSEISLNFTDDMRELIYSEGVYPTQGVRPIFSTIGSLVTPLLSDILLQSTPETKEATIGVSGGANNGFRCSEVTIDITLDKGGKILKTIPLTLGALRDPNNRESRYLTGVHESGHAILYTMLTGEFPTAIIGVSSSGGGFMSKTVKVNQSLNVSTYESSEKTIMVSLAGYVAERLLFETPKCGTGSYVDIKDAWSIVSSLVYERGYEVPFKFSAEYKIDQDTPDGMDDTTLLDDQCIIPGTAKEAAFLLIKRLYAKTQEVLRTEKLLLKKMGIELGENGVMSIDRFKELIREYSKTMTLEKLEEQKETDKNYYINILKSED